MPGIPGSGGPPPKREAQRRRKNDPAGGPADHAPGADEVVVPDVDEEWHPVARRWFESLAESGQSRFYEPSDWATAFVLAESISRELNPQGIVYKGEVVGYHPMTVKGASLAAWLRGMTALMVTEGDRRRLRLELERAQAEEAAPDVSQLDHYRSRRGSS